MRFSGGEKLRCKSVNFIFSEILNQSVVIDKIIINYTLLVDYKILTKLKLEYVFPDRT